MKLVLVSILFLISLVQDVPAVGLPGGFSEERPATPELQELVKEMKTDVEEETNRKFDRFQVVSYKSQVVAGTNYCIKVRVSQTEYLHVKIFWPLPYTKQLPRLSGVFDGKEKNDLLSCKPQPH